MQRCQMYATVSWVRTTVRWLVLARGEHAPDGVFEVGRVLKGQPYLCKSNRPLLDESKPDVLKYFVR